MSRCKGCRREILQAPNRLDSLVGVWADWNRTIPFRIALSQLRFKQKALEWRRILGNSFLIGNQRDW